MNLLDLIPYIVIPLCCIVLALYIAVTAWLLFAIFFIFIIDPIMCMLSPKWRALEPRALPTNKKLTKTPARGKLKSVKDKEE